MECNQTISSHAISHCLHAQRLVCRAQTLQWNLLTQSVNVYLSSASVELHQTAVAANGVSSRKLATSTGVTAMLSCLDNLSSLEWQSKSECNQTPLEVQNLLSTRGWCGLGLVLIHVEQSPAAPASASNDVAVLLTRSRGRVMCTVLSLRHRAEEVPPVQLHSSRYASVMGPASQPKSFEDLATQLAPCRITVPGV